MAKTSNVIARVEPEVKEQAEEVLNELGIPMSNAIGLFLRQVVLQRGIPFEMKLPARKPICTADLSEDQFKSEIEKGLASYASGRYQTADQVAEEMRSEYGIWVDGE